MFLEKTGLPVIIRNSRSEDLDRVWHFSSDTEHPDSQENSVMVSRLCYQRTFQLEQLPVIWLQDHSKVQMVPQHPAPLPVDGLLRRRRLTSCSGSGAGTGPRELGPRRTGRRGAECGWPGPKPETASAGPAESPRHTCSQENNRVDEPISSLRLNAEPLTSAGRPEPAPPRDLTSANTEKLQSDFLSRPKHEPHRKLEQKSATFNT